jgi:hypothetical protein
MPSIQPTSPDKAKNGDNPAAAEHGPDCNCTSPHPLFGLGVTAALVALGYGVFRLIWGG